MKKGPRYTGGKVPVMLVDGDLLQPATELRRLFDSDPVPPSERARTPLFRRCDGSAMDTTYVRGLVRACAASQGRLLCSGSSLFLKARYGLEHERIVPIE